MINRFRGKLLIIHITGRGNVVTFDKSLKLALTRRDGKERVRESERERERERKKKF